MERDVKVEKVKFDFYLLQRTDTIIFLNDQNRH